MPGWSQSDHNRFLARRQVITPDEFTAEERLECALHGDILNHCRRLGWIGLHSRMDKRSTSTVGHPDFVILCNEGRTLHIEAKTRKGKLREKQAALRAWADKLGHTIHLVRSYKQFIDIANT